jgi:antirestriction protein ArdC
MKTEDAHKIAGTALDRLVAALDAGQSDVLRTYLATMGKFWRYSWGNQLLIAMQRPEATHVAGYRTWQSLGRQVKKGEKGTMILAPVVYHNRREPDREQHDDGAELKPADKPTETLMGFRAAYVFDILQTEGRPLAELDRVAGEPRDYLDRLKQLVTERGITLAYSDQLGGAHGVSQGGRIVLRTGMTPAEEFEVLSHETAHEALHQDDPTSPASKTVRETEAEAVAYVVCQAIGLDTGTACSDYIQIWRGNRDTLAASLERIQRTAALIIEGIQAATSAPLRAAA